MASLSLAVVLFCAALLRWGPRIDGIVVPRRLLIVLALGLHISVLRDRRWLSVPASADT